MPRVGIVTDSTCDLGPDALAALDVRMVPLKVLFGDQTFLDWVELQPDAFYEKLAASPQLPKTSQPSPAEFLEVYRQLAEQGCESIVSIHLSGVLSGTLSSALMAADDSPIKVHVIDTKCLSHGLGLIVKSAVAAREEGLDGDAIAAKVMAVSESTRILFVLDTLEYLVKGGRAGKAQGLAAAVLNIKPVLTVNHEGIIEPYKKVKGRRRALVEMAQAAAAFAAEHGPLRAAVLHGCLDDEGAGLIAEIEATGADIEIVSAGPIGSVIGTYAGPQALGLAYHPR